VWGVSCFNDSDGGAWGGGVLVVVVARRGGADCEAHLWGVVRGDGKGGGKAGRWGEVRGGWWLMVVGMVGDRLSVAGGGEGR